jgi:hypothetical protein
MGEKQVRTIDDPLRTPWGETIRIRDVVVHLAMSSLRPPQATALQLGAEKGSLLYKQILDVYAALGRDVGEGQSS